MSDEYEHVTMAEHHHNRSRYQALSLHPRDGVEDVRRIMASDLSTEIHFTDGSVYRIAYGLISGPKGEAKIELVTPLSAKGGVFLAIHQDADADD